MRRKTDKKHPLKARGAREKNLAGSAWHDAAIRYYLLLEKIEHRGAGRYRMVTQLLDLVDGVKIKGNPITQKTVTRTLKSLKPKVEKWRTLYQNAPSHVLLDSELDAVPSYSDILIAARELSATPPDAGQRTRGYLKIVDIASNRLRSILSEAELEWSKWAAVSNAAGVEVWAFPSAEIVAKAFPDLKVERA